VKHARKHVPRLSGAAFATAQPIKGTFREVFRPIDSSLTQRTAMTHHPSQSPARSLRRTLGGDELGVPRPRMDQMIPSSTHTSQPAPHPLNSVTESVPSAQGQTVACKLVGNGSREPIHIGRFLVPLSVVFAVCVFQSTLQGNLLYCTISTLTYFSFLLCLCFLLWASHAN
jgi:hypothetical protein